MDLPRFARKQSSTGIYHIMLRGNEGKELFRDDSDRFRFLDTLHKVKEDGNYDVYAYCLMNNHVHLLMKEGKDSIQRSMKRICVSYAYYFNSKYKRTGHLFQDRFRSEVVEEDTYILAAARYIHNNPVKAGIDVKAEKYKWSSYAEYIGKKGFREGLVDRGFLLSILSDKEERAVEILKDLTSQTTHDKFIDCEEMGLETSVQKKKPEETIRELLGNKGYNLESFKSCGDKIVRNELIREIKVSTGVSVRELSRLIGISKDVIFRA